MANQYSIETLKESIDSAWKIFHHSKMCFGYAKYFYEPQDEGQAYYMRSSEQLKFIRAVLWGTGIVEIAKIYNRNGKESFNLFRIKNALIKGITGVENFDPTIIRNWGIELSKLDPTLKKIMLLRNNVYAHTTEDQAVRLQALSFPEVDSIIKNGTDFLKIIYNQIFDTEPLIDLDKKFLLEKFTILEILANQREEQLKPLLDQAKLYGLDDA